MEISKEELKITYSQMSTEELEMHYHTASLTRLARMVAEEEFQRRGHAFKKRKTAPHKRRWKSEMTTNDKIYLLLLLVSCPLVVLAPVISRGELDLFHYQPTPTFHTFILVFTLFFWGYFIITDLLNLKAKRTLVQNSLIYRLKVGSIKGNTSYWPFLPRFVATPIGAILIISIDTIFKLLLAFFVAYVGIAGILIRLGFRNLVV